MPEASLLKNKDALLKQLQNFCLVHPRCDLIILPETCLGSPVSKDWHKEDNATTNIFIQDLKKISAKHHVCLYGSVRIQKNHKTFNQAFWIDGAKKVLTYNKKHLFKYGEEHKRYTAGKQICVWKTRLGNIAPLICYDLRFPEMMRKQVFQKADIVLICAQWPEERIDHWTALIKARAIENQIFVLACNRRGKAGKLNFNGQSLAVSPWGKVLARGTAKNRFISFEVSLKDQKTIRKDYPFLKDATP